MKAGDKEFYDLMYHFEKDVASGMCIEREDRKQVPHGVFYCNATVNNLFCSYMTGYEFGKSIANDGE
jgi:hypothetical protein